MQIYHSEFDSQDIDVKNSSWHKNEIIWFWPNTNNTINYINTPYLTKPIVPGRKVTGLLLNGATLGAGAAAAILLLFFKLTQAYLAFCNHINSWDLNSFWDWTLFKVGSLPKKWGGGGGGGVRQE